MVLARVESVGKVRDLSDDELELFRHQRDLTLARAFPPAAGTAAAAGPVDHRAHLLRRRAPAAPRSSRSGHRDRSPVSTGSRTGSRPGRCTGAARWRSSRASMLYAATDHPR